MALLPLTQLINNPAPLIVGTPLAPVAIERLL
jgi:hypothetical protein